MSLSTQDFILEWLFFIVVRRHAADLNWWLLAEFELSLNLRSVDSSTLIAVSWRRANSVLQGHLSISKGICQVSFTELMNTLTDASLISLSSLFLRRVECIVTWLQECSDRRKFSSCKVNIANTIKFFYQFLPSLISVFLLWASSVPKLWRCGGSGGWANKRWAWRKARFWFSLLYVEDTKYLPEHIKSFKNKGVEGVTVEVYRWSDLDSQRIEMFKGSIWN